MMMKKNANINIRSYSELNKLPTFRERFEYLRLDGKVCVDTFGFDRFLNQRFYRSVEWKRVRDFVIVRDNGCDLGIDGFYIGGPVYIHHMNPIVVGDLLDRPNDLLNPEFLICTSKLTHDAIHYGCEPTNYEMAKRHLNDTCPWKG